MATNDSPTGRSLFEHHGHHAAEFSGVSTGDRLLSNVLQLNCGPFFGMPKRPGLPMVTAFTIFGPLGPLFQRPVRMQVTQERPSASRIAG